MIESTMLIKVATVLFIFLTLILSSIIVHLFKLQRGWRSTDIALIYCLEYYLISRQHFYHSLTTTIEPFAFGLGTNGLFLKKKKSFHYLNFIKYFWRWISGAFNALSDLNRLVCLSNVKATLSLELSFINNNLPCCDNVSFSRIIIIMCVYNIINVL